RLRQAAALALLATLSLYLLFVFFDRFFQIDQYRSVYGALGGVVLVLIAAYFAFLAFYLWAQCLYALSKVDVAALEKLFLSASGVGMSRLEGYVFGRADRLLAKYGRRYAAGEVIIREGDEDQTAYILYAGRVALFKQTAMPAATSEDESGHGRCLTPGPSPAGRGALRELAAPTFTQNDGGYIRLGELGEGELFGEMAYLLGEPRTATVVAQTDVVVLALPPQTLEALMRHSAPLARRIITALSQRLVRMNQARATA
ncbi:MAG: Crp/Fnr family transcriptional regulator, partial [Thiobacillaceae bacterium]